MGRAAGALKTAAFGLALGGSGGRSRGHSGGRSATIAARGLATSGPMAANAAAADLVARLAGRSAGGGSRLGRLTARRGARLEAPRLETPDLLHLAARLAARGARRSARCRGRNGRLATRRGTRAMEQARLGRSPKQQNQGTGGHQRQNNATVHGHTPHGKNGRLPTLGSWIGFHTINLQQLSAVPAGFFWPACPV